MNDRMNEATILLRRLDDLHDEFVKKGCPADSLTALVGAMMAVLTQKVFVNSPTQNDLMEFPTRLLNADAVWRKFVKEHPDSGVYVDNMFQKWVWGLYRGHEKTRSGLWSILGWEVFNTEDMDSEKEESHGE